MRGILRKVILINEVNVTSCLLVPVTQSLEILFVHSPCMYGTGTRGQENDNKCNNRLGLWSQLLGLDINHDRRRGRIVVKR